MALGVALFVAFGLIALVAARPGGSDLKAGPIDPAVAAPAEQLGKAFAMVAAHVRPAVVSVYSEKMVKFQAPEIRDSLRRRFLPAVLRPAVPAEASRSRSRASTACRSAGMGSGMILDKQGHVLTNYHVVSDVDEIKVQLADKTQLRGGDRQHATRRPTWRSSA